MTAISCPVCAAPFKEVARYNILIDICTRCGGVWLDRGEMEKLVTHPVEAYICTYGGKHYHASPEQQHDAINVQTLDYSTDKMAKN